MLFVIYLCMCINTFICVQSMKRALKPSICLMYITQRRKIVFSSLETGRFFFSNFKYVLREICTYSYIK